MLRAIIQTLIPVQDLSRSARLFLLSTIIFGIVFSAWSLFFNFYILAVRFDKEFLGLANSMPNLASLLLGVPMGVVSDRMGRRKAMLLGVFIYVIMLATQLIFQVRWAILAAAFLAGVGYTLYFVSQNPFLMEISTGQMRAILFSINAGLSILAGVIGNLFAGRMPGTLLAWFEVPLNSALSYQIVLLVSVAIGLFTLLPIYFIHEPRPETPSLVRTAENSGPLRKNFQDWLDLFSSLRKPTIWLLVTPNLLIGTGAAILIPYLNIFFSEVFQISDKALGALFSYSALLTGVLTVLGPRLISRAGGKVRLIVITEGLSLIFLLMIGFSPLYWLAALGFLMRAGLMNMAAPIFHAFALESVDVSDRSNTNSLLNTAWMFGWTIGPIISGVVQVEYGFRPLFIASFLLYIIAIAFIWHFFRDIEKAGVRLEKELPMESQSA